MSFHKTYEEALAHKLSKPQKPRTPLRSRSSLKRGKKRLGPGKKTKQWNSARAAIKRRFEKAGITTCELQGSDRVKHECGVDNFLGFAHDAKRRKLSKDDLYCVILVCNFAHQVIEIWPAEEMKAIVNETIHSRRVQPYRTEWKPSQCKPRTYYE